MDIRFRPIGWIRTPYKDNPPNQPDPEVEGEFRIDLDPDLTDGLYKLESFHYIYVLFYQNRPDKPVSLRVRPPGGGGVEVGLFASRSPRRPNPIGISTVRLKRIEDNRLYISGIDVLDRTPLLDIKPYLKKLDAKEDADNGWSDKTD